MKSPTLLFFLALSCYTQAMETSHHSENKTEEVDSSASSTKQTPEEITLEKLGKDMLQVISHETNWAQIQNHIRALIPLPSQAVFQCGPSLLDLSDKTQRFLSINSDSTLILSTFLISPPLRGTEIMRVEIRDLKSLTLLHTFKIPDPSEIISLMFSSNNEHIICLKSHGLIEIYDCKTGLLDNTFQDKCANIQDTIFAMAFDKTDVLHIARYVQGQKHIAIYTPNTPSQCTVLDSTQHQLLRNITFSPSARYISNIASTANTEVIVWNIRQSQPRHIFIQPGHMCSRVEFSSNEQFLIASWLVKTNPSKALYLLYDTRTGALLRQLPETIYSRDFAFANNLLFFISKEEPQPLDMITFFTRGTRYTINAYDIDLGTVIKTIGTHVYFPSSFTFHNNTSPRKIATSSDGRSLALVSRGNQESEIYLKVFDITMLDSTELHKLLLDKNSPAKIILLKALLEQLTTAARNKETVPLKPEDHMLLRRLPAKIKDLYAGATIPLASYRAYLYERMKKFKQYMSGQNT